MKKFRLFFLVLALVLCLAIPANAVSAATDVQSFTTVSSDGTASVTINLTVRMEQGDSSLVFPLPKNATSASVNGSSYHISESGGVKYVSISKATGGMPGTFSMSIHYTLENVLSFGKNNILLATIPVLSGFSYPTEYAEFSIIFPGEITGIPTFSSLYLQSAMDSIISYTIDGSTLSGVVTKELKDHDSFEVQIPVSTEQFSEAAILMAGGTWVTLAMIICIALALLHWLLFLRCLPVLPQRKTIAPMDITAGDVGAILAGQGSDLTLMVLSWAQMGYLLIETDARGRILIRKRMDMGNERSLNENKIFHALFRKKDIIDGGSKSYAILCRKVASSRKGVAHFFHTFAGNPKVFCWLCAFAAGFAGVNLTKAMVKDGFFQYFWGALICAMTLLSGKSIQDLTGLWFLNKWDKKLTALLSILLWLLLGYLSGEMILCLIIIGIELLAGILGCYSARRNAAGRQLTAELLGLRRYLFHLSRENRYITDNPDYFYKLLPFAMALGVEDRLAKAYSRVSLPECTYLLYGSRKAPKAEDFVKKVREITSSLDERQKMLLLERILGK